MGVVKDGSDGVGRGRRARSQPELGRGFSLVFSVIIDKIVVF